MKTYRVTKKKIESLTYKVIKSPRAVTLQKNTQGVRFQYGTALNVNDAIYPH